MQLSFASLFILLSSTALAENDASSGSIMQGVDPSTGFHWIQSTVQRPIQSTIQRPVQNSFQNPFSNFMSWLPNFSPFSRPSKGDCNATTATPSPGSLTTPSVLVETVTSTKLHHAAKHHSQNKKKSRRRGKKHARKNQSHQN